MAPVAPSPQRFGSAEHEWLALWERAATRRAVDRDEALLSFGETAPPRALSGRNVALLRLRARLFGPALALRCTCPRCTATAEFTIDCAGLAQVLQSDADADSVHALEHDGWRLRFRLPDADDLRAAAVAADDAGFALGLLRRCLLHSDAPPGVDTDALPEAVAEALSQRMEVLDPGANVGFELLCPDCATAWAAAMDVGQVLWSELQSRAERVLLEVDALARAYGWNESEVLALSPARRAAYLQLIVPSS